MDKDSSKLELGQTLTDAKNFIFNLKDGVEKVEKLVVPAVGAVTGISGLISNAVKVIKENKK